MFYISDKNEWIISQQVCFVNTKHQLMEYFIFSYPFIVFLDSINLKKMVFPVRSKYIAQSS